MRMRQSLTQFEVAFREEAAESIERREQLRKEAAQRSRARRVERVHKHGRLRFIGLIVTILATTAIVTWMMFQMLAQVAG